LDQWECEYTIKGLADALRNDIITSTAVAVSDGSFQWGNSAAAWTIEGSTALNWIKGTGRTPGQATNQSVYRSELFGLWGILFALKWFMDDYQIKQGQVFVACNDILALRKVKTRALTDPNEKHYDFISAIQNLQLHLPLTLCFWHVKGHQDSGLTTVLSREA